MKTSKVLLAAAAVAALGVVTAAQPAMAAKKGGTLNIAGDGAFDYIDPALSYLSTSWQSEFVTGVKLVNYPDVGGPAVASTLIPEAAVSLPVISNKGKTYTFTIRKGFKFSPPSNQVLTAANFKRAFERLADPSMASPSAPFIANVVGAQDKLDKKAATVKGVVAKGNKLTINLIRPDASWLAQLAMPFFIAVPTNAPINPEGQTPLASAGPYYVSQYTPEASLTLKKNPNYKGKRPSNFNEIRYKFKITPDAEILLVKKGEADYALGGVPPAEYAGLWSQYGPTSANGKKGKQQFFVNPELGTAYYALNNNRASFKTNIKNRQAVNFALDRPNLVKQGGAYSGKTTDQILPPGMPGFVDIKVYPTDRPDVNKAKSLVSGQKELDLFFPNTAAHAARAAIAKANLDAAGFNVNLKPQVRGGAYYTVIGERSAPFDLAWSGWIADYNDPFDFVNVLMDGDNIQESNNNNYAYFNDPKFNAAMDAAAKTTGAARSATYAKLDADITRNSAPWAPYQNFNNREFFSGRIGCHKYVPAYAGMNLAALCIR